MKVYANKFDLATPSARQVTTPSYSDFGLAIKVLRNGAEFEAEFTLEKDGETLTPEADKIDGYTVYLLASEGPGAAVYKVRCGDQSFDMVCVSTDESVFEVKPGPDTKYGATLASFLGDVNENGILLKPTVPFAFESEEIKSIPINFMYGLTAYNPFRCNTNLTSVSLPNLSSTNPNSMNYMFIGCKNLSSVSMPKLKIAGPVSMMGTFAGTSVSEFEFPELETIDEQGMMDLANDSQGTTQSTQTDTELRRASFPKLKAIGYDGLAGAFKGCTKLSCVEFPELTTLSGSGSNFYNTFYGCKSLKTVSFPNLSGDLPVNAFSNAFAQCSQLEHISMPNVISAGSNAFYQAFNLGMTSLKTVDFAKMSYATGTASRPSISFYNCTSLQYVNFSEASAVVSLTTANAFGNTNDTYKVIVPDALYEEWIAATNWNAISAHIVKASDYAAVITNYNGADDMDN